MVLARYKVPYAIRNSKIIRYYEVWATSERVAITATKKYLRPIKHSIYVNGIVSY